MLIDRLLKSSVIIVALGMIGLWTQNVLHPDHEGTLSDDTLTVFKLPLDFAEEYSPACVSLTEDGQLLAFQSPHPDNIGGHDIWLSHYRDGRWTEPVNAGPGINTSASEYDGKLSADGTEMAFIRSDDEMMPSIFISTFRDGRWTEAVHVGAPVSYKDQTEYGAVFSRDGNRLYFSSNREGSYNGFDVYYSERTDTGWGDPVNLGPTINSKGDAIDAAIGRDDKTIILAFTNEESDSEQMDLYISKKTNEGWSTYRNMGPRINTPGNEACPWLGYDGHRLLVNSTWEGLIHGEERTDTRWGSVHVFHSSKGFE
jgi:hypothetical protein